MLRFLLLITQEHVEMKSQAKRAACVEIEN